MSISKHKGNFLDNFIEYDFKITSPATFLHRIKNFICFLKTQEIAGGNRMHEFSCDGGSIKKEISISILTKCYGSFNDTLRSIACNNSG